VTSESHIITGGGVRDKGDLKTLERAGVNEVMIATALHNGSFTPRQLARYVGE
jgi:uncharacterized protein related to proFAR isomerase